MSKLYWKNLKNDLQEDSELLKEYQILSEKINEYFPEHTFLCEVSLTSSIPEITSKQKNDKHQQKSFSSPKNLEQRAIARIEKYIKDNSENVEIKANKNKSTHNKLNIRRASCMAESSTKKHHRKVQDFLY